MRYVIILADGMADLPCDTLGGLTPLESATTPASDRLARMGRCGMLRTVPDGFYPGSETAHLSLLGYDLREVDEGRGVLEAASMGIFPAPGEIVMRCNLVTLSSGGVLTDHSAGHISTAEAARLVEALDRGLADGRARFFPGVGYRHVLRLAYGDKRISCPPPQDVRGMPAGDMVVAGCVPEASETAAYVNSLVIRSREILGRHPVNLRRIREGKLPANSIWPWSPGERPAIMTFKEMYGVQKSVVVAGVDHIKGIGVYAGMDVARVEGATGYYDTDYDGKARAALRALEEGADFVFLHIEAPDEAGHEGDARLKRHILEQIDRRVVAPVLASAMSSGDVGVALLPDHPTPCSLRRHTQDAVPFAMWFPGIKPDEVEVYSERACASGGCGYLRGGGLIRAFLGR